MNDQWPRFEVFKQDAPGQPHRNVGSVHAPDAEMALLNARDVFARRPACHSLWVVPAGAILARTAEELAAGDLPVRGDEGETEPYAVFQKRSQRQAMTYVDYVGDVSARSPAGALAAALDAYADDAVVVWWVCPARQISRSAPEDTAALYDPAREKLFRMPNQYHTVFTMQQIRRRDEEEEG
jgi:ring-1,2-phenylacetyl-CoA epoxidase subunit PaaB